MQNDTKKNEDVKRELSNPPKSDDKCELSLDETDAVELKDEENRNSNKYHTVLMHL